METTYCIELSLVVLSSEQYYVIMLPNYINNTVISYTDDTLILHI